MPLNRFFFFFPFFFVFERKRQIPRVLKFRSVLSGREMLNGKGIIVINFEYLRIPHTRLYLLPEELSFSNFNCWFLKLRILEHGII